MLEITGLCKQFGATRALDNISLRLKPGEMVGVIGRSGAGKSTLLRSINRLVDPDAGRIVCQGREVGRLRGQALRLWRRECAMIFQQFNLVARLDVLTNVLLGRLSHRSTAASLAKWFSQEERALAMLTLDRVNLFDAALQRADTLSGGQQQRVAIARALVQEPRLLLADEPIASLDPRNATRVMDILRNINREDGITVICNLHTLDTARRYCDRVIGMRAGRVVYDGSPAGLDRDRVAAIYGESGDEDFDEQITSTAIPERIVDTARAVRAGAG